MSSTAGDIVLDLVVIGGGPGGYAAAFYAASAGLQVGLVERDAIGGTCLNRGCIPAKAFLETAAVRRHVAHASSFGINATFEGLDFSTTQLRKQGIVETLQKGLLGLTRSKKVQFVEGAGRLMPSLQSGEHQVLVTHTSGTTQVLRARNVVLATGSTPRTIPNFDRGGSVLTSDEVLNLNEIPRRILVVGGGAIGCEFASMFADLGAEVTVVEGAPRILAGVDADISQVVTKSFRKKNIRIVTNAVCVSHSPSESGATTVTLSSGEQVEVDAVVLAVGRKPCTEGLGLEETSVTVSPRGFVEVDELCRTSVQSIFAVGDLIDTPQLAHVAYAEAILVIKQILNETAIPVDYDRVPWAIYCHPEVAWAGLSEFQAKEAGLDVVISKHQFRSNSRAMITGETDGLVKVIALKNADGKAGQILGVHMTGPWVTEQLGAGYLAVNWEASVEEVAHLVQPHPSLSELFGETVLALTGRSINS